MGSGARRRRFVLGLTGGIGSGKSTVLAMFRRLGAETADSDAVVHEVTAPMGEAYKRVVQIFGEQVLSPSGGLDRTAIARIVFRNPKLRRKLERILHPIVTRRLRRVARASKKPIVVLDIPLLYEAGLRSLVDEVLCVWAPKSARLRRLRSKGRFFAADVRRRIDSQMPLEEKRRRAEHVIDNSLSFGDTRRQVYRLWGEFRRRGKV